MFVIKKAGTNVSAFFTGSLRFLADGFRRDGAVPNILKQKPVH